ncbi:MAG: TetR family transcriptional regulator [Mycobacterium sp.]
MAAEGRESFGLRERKKLRTRAKLIDVAVDLSLRQGYDKTTVDQIAAAADVSSRTFSRYFPTKESVIVAVGHDLDQAVAAALAAQPLDVNEFEAMKRAHIEVFRPDGPFAPAAFNRMAIMIQIVNASQQLNAAAFSVRESLSENASMNVIAKRLGVAIDDPSVRILADWWTTLFSGAFAGLGEPDNDPIDARIVCDRIETTFAMFTRLMLPWQQK